MFAVTRPRGVTFCNTQWLGYSGQTEEQACGVGFLDHVHPEDLDKCRIPMFTNEGQRKESLSRVPSDSTDSSSRQESAESLDSGTTIQAESARLPVTHTPLQLPSGEVLKLSYDQSGRPFYSAEVRLRSKGSEISLAFSPPLLAEPAPGDECEETWYGTCTDINDHKLLEQTLERDHGCKITVSEQHVS